MTAVNEERQKAYFSGIDHGIPITTKEISSVAMSQL